MQPQKVKKIPQRQCLGCNEHFPKKELKEWADNEWEEMKKLRKDVKVLFRHQF